MIDRAAEIARIRAVMHERGLSQTDVARVSGISNTELCRFLNGQRRFNIDRLNAIDATLLALHASEAARACISEITSGGHRLYRTIAAMCRANGVRP